MADFSDITIVCVDGRPGPLHSAQNALIRTGMELPGARMLLLSPPRDEPVAAGVRHEAIRSLGYIDYSIFMLYGLHEFIETDFALIVQDDGWAMNGAAWRDEYRDYDIIGAPSQFGRVRHGDQVEYFKRYDWAASLGEEGARVEFVQNGGFSLRSRRLLKIMSERRFPYTLAAPTGLMGTAKFLYWERFDRNEDVCICHTYRDQLEAAGIRYAPLDIASTFAFEHLSPQIHRHLDLGKVLGHHSQFRQMSPRASDEFSYRLRQSRLDKAFRENEVIALFRDLGYRVRIPEG